MTVREEELEQRRDLVIATSKQHIEWYEKHSGRKRFGYWISVFAIGLLGVTGMIIGALDDIPTIWRIAPPALTTLMAFLAGHFRWQSDWIRFSLASQALKSELFKYETAASAEYSDDLPPNQRIANLANRVDAIVKNEADRWRSALDEASNRSDNLE